MVRVTSLSGVVGADRGNLVALPHGSTQSQFHPRFQGKGDAEKHSQYPGWPKFWSLELGNNPEKS